MKIGIITDIHNNIEALNAVLDNFFQWVLGKLYAVETLLE